jgi:hypothetical protein
MEKEKREDERVWGIYMNCRGMDAREPVATVV